MSNTQKACSLLSVEGVGRTFHTPAGDFTALADVSLELKPGSFAVLCGASGSGKTTLLHLIAALDTPTRGRILFSGEPIPRTPSRVAPWRARNIGLVFQFFQLLPTLRAVENVMLPMEFDTAAPGGRRGIRRMRTRAMDLLAAVGLADLAEKLPQQLSGGEQQRVAIARSLANDPALLLADEPTGNLDSENADRMIELLTGFTRTGTTVLMVTHDESRSARFSTRFVLQDGRRV